jgi:polyketide-type polyunsaturated fatty acid synthase PfaA
MACLLPRAANLQIYWHNILNKVDAITEVPEDRWDWRIFYDPDPKARDRVYSKWGGFVDALPFDPMRYGMPPNSLAFIEPLQLLTLETVQAALEDAGYGDHSFGRERTSVILGVGSTLPDLGQQYIVRSKIPMFFQNISAEILDRLPEWSEDTFPGIISNVTAGRVANRFDLGGMNYTVDAACASSLAAVYLAVEELEKRSSDMVIVGGADTFQNPYAYFCFSKTQALSPTGRCRTLDNAADGITLGEGIAILVLKRLNDAERDGDRIYAVIRGVGGSSDGRARGLTAPRPEGQKLALERAYARAGFSPATVGLIEAHGTGTVAGDRTEIETLKSVFEAAGAHSQNHALGSVKSMIGHTKCTAGAAGLVKVALALYHKVLPPTINVDTPNPALAKSPFYVNTESRPWIHTSDSHPRRAGVSSFGFGGTNFHAVIEEYSDTFLNSTDEAVSQSWPGELLLWRGESRDDILASIKSLGKELERGAWPTLHSLAYTLWRRARGRPGLTLAMVVPSVDDLQEKLPSVLAALSKPGYINDPRGIYFTDKPLAKEGKVAFLFPGQGSQYVNMFGDLAIHFSEVRHQFELADTVLTASLSRPLSTYIFPPPCFSPEDTSDCQQALTQTNVAQPALCAASMGGLHLLHALKINPDMVAGHSSGEYAALCAAGVIEEAELYRLSEARGRYILEAGDGSMGTMVAVVAEAEIVRETVKSVENVWIANLNAPLQTVISGTRAGLEEAAKRFQAEGIQTRPLAVSCAFHSPLVAPARDRLAGFIATMPFAEPQLDVYSNTTAAPYPRVPKDTAALLSQHLTRPVEFVEEIQAMHRSGARIFVEVGPRNVLTGLTQQILGEQSYLAVAMDLPNRSGLLQLIHLLGQLAAHGVSMQLDRLYQGRGVRELNPEALMEDTKELPPPPTAWMINGGYAWPLRPPSGKSPTRQAGALDEEKGGVSVERQRKATFAQEATAGATEIPTPSTTARPESFEMVSSCGGKSETPSEDQLSPCPRAAEVAASRVMLEFQRKMKRFLEVQQQIILASFGKDEKVKAFTPDEASEFPQSHEISPANSSASPCEDGEP